MAINGVGNPTAAYQGSGLEKMANQANQGNQVKQVSAEGLEVMQAAKTGVEEKEKKTDASNKESKEPLEILDQRSESVKRAVDEINRKAKNTEAIFGVHEATKRVTIKIVDKESRDVIREYPPEKTLDMISKVWELAGILVDEKR